MVAQAHGKFGPIIVADTRISFRLKTKTNPDLFVTTVKPYKIYSTFSFALFD